MEGKSHMYVPYIFRNFQGFSVEDIKEFHKTQHIRIILKKEEGKVQLCSACGHKLGHYHDWYAMEVRHLKVFNWSVSLVFFREKRHCGNSNKVRSEILRSLIISDDDHF